MGRNQTTAHLANGLTQCCSRSCQFLSKCAFLLTITLADDLPTAIVVESGCPYPAHLFIDVLAKIGHVNNASSHCSDAHKPVATDKCRIRPRDMPEDGHSLRAAGNVDGHEVLGGV